MIYITRNCGLTQQMMVWFVIHEALGFGWHAPKLYTLIEIVYVTMVCSLAKGYYGISLSRGRHPHCTKYVVLINLPKLGSRDDIHFLKQNEVYFHMNYAK